MFLDDQLLEIFKQKAGRCWDPDLLEKLYIVVENHYKPQFSDEMSKAEIAIILDRTFASWDLFITKAEKFVNQENSVRLHNVLNWLKAHNYKKAFLSNEQMARIYHDVKNYKNGHKTT